MLPSQRDRQTFGHPLQRVNRRPGTTDVIQQEQLPARNQDAAHLGKCPLRIWNGAQRQGAHDRVDRRILNRQVRCVALAKVDSDVQLGGSRARDGQHLWAEFHTRQGDIEGVVREAATGADGNFQYPAARVLAKPFAPARELNPFEERDLLVVTGRGLAPDALLLRGRCLAGLRFRVGHDWDPSGDVGGRRQSATGPPAASTTPITARRTRAAAWSGSGWPASSHAMMASIATVGANCAAHRASRGSGTAMEICRYAAATMSERNFSIRSLNSGSRTACMNNSRNPAGDSIAAARRPSMLSSVNPPTGS